MLSNNDNRLSAALNHCATLVELNYDQGKAASRLVSGSALFDEIKRSVIASKHAKVDARRKAQVIGQRRRCRERVAGGSFTDAEWQAKLKEYAYTCAYCHRPTKRLTVDHVVPISRGGRNEISNIVPACRSCNSRKGAR